MFWLTRFGLKCHYTGWGRKKFPHLKIHNTKTTSRIWIIQILVKSRKIKVFLWFCRCPTSTTNVGKFNFTKILWLQNDWKMAQNIDQCINDCSQRIMKEMQLLMGERYPLCINCHGIENRSYLFASRCLITLEGGETPIAYCSVWIESLRFDQCFRPFFRHFATMKFLWSWIFQYFLCW